MLKKYLILFSLFLFVLNANEFLFSKNINKEKYMKIIKNVKYKYHTIDKLIVKKYSNNIIFDTLENLNIFDLNILHFFKEESDNKNLFIYLKNMKNLYSKIILLSNKNLICLNKSKSMIKLNKCNDIYEIDLEKYYIKYKNKLNKTINNKQMKNLDSHYEYFLQDKTQLNNIDLIEKLQKDSFKKEWYKKEKDRLYSNPYTNID